MTRPLISVVTPAYRAGPFIGKMIQSMLDQTYPDWELIIVDDGSDDNQCEVVEDFLGKDSRITLHRSPHDCNSVAFNLGLSFARGEYIACQEADDWSEPTRFERQIDELERVGADLVSCLMVRRRGRVVIRGRDVGGTGCVPEEFCSAKYTKGPAYGTIVAKRRVYDKVGGLSKYCEDHITYCDDSEWIFRVLSVGDPPFKWAHVHDELYNYRTHSGQMSRIHRTQLAKDHSVFRAKYAPQILARLCREKKGGR